jgi:hypothetical protein
MRNGTSISPPIFYKLFTRRSPTIVRSILQATPAQSAPKHSALKTFWIKMPGFMDVVQGVCNENSPMLILVNFPTTNSSASLKTLHQWSKKLFRVCKVQVRMALNVILRLDIAHESRVLGPRSMILEED